MIQRGLVSAAVMRARKPMPRLVISALPKRLMVSAQTVPIVKAKKVQIGAITKAVQAESTVVRT